MLYEPPKEEPHRDSFDFGKDSRVQYDQIAIRDSVASVTDDDFQPGGFKKVIRTDSVASVASVNEQSFQNVGECFFLPVYFAVFVDFLGFGLILPSIPLLAKQFGAGGFEMGVLSSSYSVAQMIGSFACGVLSDKYGRKPILLYSLFGSAVSLTLMGMVEGLWPLIAVRAADGLMSGTAGTAQAYIADVTPPSDRARRIGLMSAAAGLGVVAGPALGGIFVELLGFTGTCYVGAGISLFNFFLGVFFMKESYSVKRRATAKKLTLGQIMSIVCKEWNLLAIMISFFLSQVGFTAFQTIYVLYVSDKFQVTESTVGYIFAAFGLTLMVGQIIFGGTIPKIFGEKGAIMQGCVLRAACLALVPHMGTLWVNITMVMGVALSGALIAPCLAALVSKFAEADVQGSLLGVNQMVGALSRCIAPLICGWLYEFTPPKPIPFGAYPFYFGGISMLLVFVVMIPVSKGGTEKDSDGNEPLIDPTAARSPFSGNVGSPLLHSGSHMSVPRSPMMGM